MLDAHINEKARAEGKDIHLKQRLDTMANPERGRYPLICLLPLGQLFLSPGQ